MRIALLAALLATCAGAAGIVSFTPQGAVREVRQAKARFSDSMVRFGDPRLADPFEIACGEEKGQGHWLDDKTWVYDFARDLPAASNCQFSLKNGIRTLKGEPLTANRFVFNTGGPEPGGIEHVLWPADYEPVSENQVFIVPFAAPPTAASLLAHTRCEVEGLRERIPVLALPAAERDQLLLGLFGKDRRQWPVNPEALRCQRSLPADGKMALVFDAGLAAANGLSLREPMRFEYRVRPRFSAWIACERLRDQAACVPIAPIELRFSAGVDLAQLQAVTLASPDGGQRWTGEPIRERDQDTVEDEGGKRLQLAYGVRFKPPFPENAGLRLGLSAGLHDEFGRPLANAAAFPQTVRIDRFPPLAKFAADFGIVERSIGVLPVTVRNVGEPTRPADAAAVGLWDKLATLVSAATGSAVPAARPQGLPYRQLNLSREPDILRWYQRLKRGAAGEPDQDYRAASLLRNVAEAQRLRLPAPADDKAAEVIGLPLPAHGLTVIEIESARLGQRLLQPAAPMQVATGALVTNLAVHLRRGLDDALVWVTTLDKGWLVNAAAISVFDCKGRLLASGKTDKQGVWQYPQPLPAGRYDCPLFVFARQGEDVSFVVSDWDQGIEPWRFGIATEYSRDQRRAFHAVLDRGLYRAGETVSMKLLARERTGQGFGWLADKQLPNQLRLVHLGSDDSVVLPLQWQAGAAEVSWRVPAEARLGSYAVRLERKQGKEVQGLGDAGSFSVAEFRVPLMRGTLKLPVDPVAPARLDALAQLQYLAGGPAAGEAVKLRGSIRPLGVRRVAAFDGFSFAHGDVAAAVLRGGDAEPSEDEPPDTLLESRDATLDKTGAAVLPLAGWGRLAGPMQLHAELEYRDPNGDTQTTAASTVIWPASLQLGMRMADPGPQGVEFDIAAASLAGQPLAGRNVQVEAWLRQTDSHRKRLVGGFYSYQHHSRYQPLGELCRGKTDAKGRFNCLLPVRYSGEIIARAHSVDEAGRDAYTHTELYAPGPGADWVRANDSDRIDLIADKAAYQAGETASLRVQMPFQTATALVAVEREGVLAWHTQVLTADRPLVKVPLKASYGPNVYVSVLLVRGRLAEPAATALVDLAKPAYKLGIAKLRVGGQAYALNVKLTADKPLYQTREQAQVRIAVQTADGRPLPKGAEVALAAVDEGLLALRANDSWQLLQAMLGERPYGFSTATAQGQVIGKRHFGRKAVPVGGGGGRAGTRELFDTLLLWKGRVALNDKGEANVSVPLNDALSSFRIVAVATAGPDRFGSGETTIRASKDVMLFSGLARSVRQGDRFDAGFTVRNTTAQPVRLTINARAEGLPALSPQTLELAAGAARELAWPVQVPADAQRLNWIVQVNGDGGRHYDSLAQSQTVAPAVPERVLQATLVQLAPDYRLPLAPPPDALPGRGGVQVRLSASLAGALLGVEAYLGAYPYTCLEQLTSRAMGLNDQASWRAVVSQLDSYLDSDGLAKYFPGLGRGSPVLTAHLLTLAADSGWPLPDTARERMKRGLLAYVSGRLTFAEQPQDSTSRAIYQLDALAALARHDALRPAMLDGLVLEPNRWPSSTVLDWLAILERLPDLPDRPQRLAQARQILQARLDWSGTALSLNGPTYGQAWWLMDSTDADAARLLLDAVARNLAPDELGRMARGLLARQRQGHWDTTIANAWGALALRRFAQQVEAGPVSGSTLVSLGQAQRFDWGGAGTGTLKLPWPATDGTLTLRHQGAGKPWAQIEARAAVPLATPLNMGYRLEKQWLPQEGAGKGLHRGDIWRVRLTVEAQADMAWVVVDDPVPAGAQLLGRGLATDSTLLAAAENRAGYRPAFEERGETAYRAYYEWLPKGRHVLEYTVRFNGRGEFRLPPSRVEAMYAPERYGELPNAVLKVE